MNLDLDRRQRAMLAEMGVRVWSPQPAEATPTRQAAPAQTPLPTPTSATAAARPSAPDDGARAPTSVSAPAKPPEPVTVPVAITSQIAGIDSMDWPALRDAVAACQACPMCLGRRAAVMAAPTQSTHADWFILGEPADEAQERAGQPFVGDAGLLLDNMLRAVGVRRQDENPGTPAAPTAYLSLVLKCRPALPTAADAQALQACAGFLRREIALVQPKVIVAMGRLAMQWLLSEDHPQGLKLPLGKLRGQVWHYQGVPVVVTYPPAYLLRNGQDKARAWEDLCLAADVAEGKTTPD